jgi:hypothetical protein
MEKGTPVLLVKGLRISPNEVCDTHIEFFTRVFSCLVFHAGLTLASCGVPGWLGYEPGGR